jgi:hypothetical protein
MSELVTVAKVLYTSEAESIRLLLEANEIPVALQGANAANVLSHVGSAVGTRVLVPEEFEDRARQLIASQDRRRTRAAEQGAWYCGPCREEVDAGFETCWSCGQPREEAERPFPQDRKTAEAEPPTAVDISGKAPGDETVRRAWRAAALGLGFMPVVSHVYSAALLLEASGHWDSLSRKSKERFRRTMILDGLVLGGFVVLLSMIFARF